MNTIKKVSYILILIFILTIFLSGCRLGLYNLSNFVLPDDIDFINCIEKLDTPKKTCSYMKENFTLEGHYFYAPDPYTLWLTQKGDCNDCATFAIFVANYHGYPSWQIHIYFKGTFKYHVLAVYLENGKYTYSSGKAYYPLYATSFKEIVSDCFTSSTEEKLKSYKVYDYNMNLIEKGYAS